VNEVEQILRAQESAGWMVGDLIVKELGSDTDKVEEYIKNDLTVRLEARGLDIEYERLRSYYRTALRNPPEKRNGVSFTAAEEAGDKPERFGWYAKRGASLSKREVRKLRGDRKLDTAAGSGNLTEREKIEQAVKLLIDLKQTDAALELLYGLESDMFDALYTDVPAIKDMVDEYEKSISGDRRSGGGGGGRRSSEWDDGDRLAEELDRFNASLAQRYEALAGTLSAEHAVQTRLLASISKLRSTLDLFEDGLTNGLTFDQFLASLNN
jgi:hypothetical protein